MRCRCLSLALVVSCHSPIFNSIEKFKLYYCPLTHFLPSRESNELLDPLSLSLSLFCSAFFIPVFIFFHLSLKTIGVEWRFQRGTK